ncbi:MAG: peptide ABC transporter substrate-binding protein, partial [Chloroflexi bacterium]|nr:peptide ABC transporter substrate-binding protein [Chloroflexota bacterium]
MRATRLHTVITAVVILGIVLAGCGPAPMPTPTSPPAVAPTKAPPAAPTATPPPTAVPTKAPVVNTFGVKLPDDAAPPDKQVLYIMGDERTYLDLTKSVYKYQWGGALMTEPLVRVNNDYEILPNSGAAESWEAAADGLTWVFRIRKGMQWSDGAPFTARDFEFSFKRMADPATGYDVAFNLYAVKNFEAANKGKVPVDQIGAKALDDYTFQVITENPTPFLPMLMNESWVAPKHIVEKYGDTWSLDPKTAVSGGPYKLEKWEKGKEVVFVANPMYRGPWKPYLEKIVYKIGGPEALLSAYLAGENDAIYEDYEGTLSPADQKKIDSDPVLKQQLHRYLKMQSWYITFGGGKYAFKDPKVRQAFAHAIDRDALIKSALGGQAVPLYGMLPVGFHCSNTERLKGYQNYDVAAAKKLLADAGFPNGQGFPKYTLSLRAAPPNIVSVAEGIQAMLKQNLGVEITVENLERKTFTDRMAADDLPLYLIPWGMDYYDAYNFLGVFYTGFRHPWSNSQYDSLMKQANSLVGDPKKRCDLYQQA